MTGFLGYHALAPAVHGFHHRDGALLLDIALRIALPLLGAAADHEYLPYALLTGAGDAGASAGAAAAVAIDALVLSWDTRRMQPERAASVWSPRLCVGPRGVTAGLGGAF